MNGVKVDTEKVRETIKDLKSIKKSYSKRYSEPLPEVGTSKGKMTDEVESMLNEIQITWKELFRLVDKTIEFLTKTSESIEYSDEQSAKAVKNK